MKHLLTLSLALLLAACGNSRGKQAEKPASIVSGKTLVAYFSATGTTAKVAQDLAKATDADLFQITPVRPYTEKDLDWHDKGSRSSLEMNDKMCRPEISQRLTQMPQYETVYLGFPIWWGTAPRIINTFLEQYDLKGKAVILFATSGGSGFEQSLQDLRPSAIECTIEEGRVFNDNPSVKDLKKWAKDFRHNNPN